MVDVVKDNSPVVAIPEAPGEQELYAESLVAEPKSLGMEVPDEDEVEENAPRIVLEPEFSEEELATPVDSYSEGLVNTFEPESFEAVAPADRGQLEGVTDMVNSLGATQRPATMEDMRRAFNEDVFGPLDEAINNLLAAEGPARQAQAMAVLNRTDISVEQRLDIVRSIAEEAKMPDMNIVERASMKKQADAEFVGNDDDDEAAYIDALQNVAEVPRLARVEAPAVAEVTGKELQRSLEEMLDLQIMDADERAGVLNFLPNLLPFYSAIPISRITKKLESLTGESLDLGPTGAAFLNGTALRLMREKVETMPVEKKIEFLGEVVRVLKPNSGVLHHENAYVTLYTIQSLFYKDATGEDYTKVASDKENKAYISELSKSDHLRRKALHEPDPIKQEELRKEAAGHWQAAQNIANNASGRMWEDLGKPTFTQWLDDMAIMDFMALPALALGTVKLGQKGAMGTFRRMMSVAPDATTKLAISALENPAVRKKLGKLLGEDIVETMLPAATREAQQAGINGMVALEQRSKRLQDEIVQTRIEGSSVTAATQRAFRAELEQQLGQTSKGVLHMDKSTFKITPEGVDYVVHYGRTDSKPFSTLASAKKALEELPAHAKVVELGKDGKFKVVPDAKKSGRGQFYVAYSDSRKYDSSKTLWETVAFDRAQVRDPWFLPSSVAPLAKAWNWFLPSGSMFGKGITNEVASSAMRTAVVQKLQMGLTRTMLHLPKNEQYVVSALLKQGEELGTVLRVDQIRTLYPKASDAVITSYYEARTLADNMYELANGQQRTEWFRAGVKELTSPTGHVGFGRVLKSADDAVGDIKPGYQKLHVFDPDTGQFATMSRADIDAVYARGGSVARLEDMIQGPKFAEATHVIMDGKKVKARELPRHVLPKIPGYYPHIFQGNHIVYGVSQAGNKVALSVAKTVGDARREVARLEKVMQRMAAKGGTRPYATIDYKFDRSLRDPLIQGKDAADPIFGATSKVYGTRTGRMLRNASKQHGEHMVDPIEALLRGMELVSMSVSKGNLIKHMEQRLTNTLRLMEKESGARIIKDPKRVVKTPDDINNIQGVAKDYRKALAYMQQIDMVRHIPDGVERHMATGFVWASDMFDKIASKVEKIPLPGAKSVAADLDAIGGKLVERATKGVDPTRLLTEFAHRVYIAANPVQQFALQLSQALMLTGVSSRDLPKAISRSVPVAMLLYLRTMQNSPDLIRVSDKAAVAAYQRALKNGAKLTGMDVNELDKFLGVIERSGFVDNVSMHSQIRTTARSQAHSRMLSSASTLNKGAPQRVTTEMLEKLDEGTFGLLSKLGFEAGEQYNRIITLLTLYQRDVRKGVAKLDKPAYVQSLVGEANELVGSMLRETSMGYQRGWLKAAFQFVAFQHKMAGLMLTSKQFTPLQKAKMTAAQFALFGSRGAFHLDAAHRAFESWAVDFEAANPGEKNKMLELFWHPTTQSVLDGMVFDIGVNTLMRTVLGEDTPGFAWNRRIAPGGGTEMMAQALIELRDNPTEKVFGLSRKHGSKVIEFFEHVRNVMLAQSKDLDDVPVGERMHMLAKEGLSLAFSGYDKYLAASAAQAMGGWVSDTGNIVTDSGTGIEHSLYTILGVNTETREAYYDATDKLYADVRNDPEKKKAALENIADQMFRRLIDESVKFSREAPTPEVYDALQGREVQNRALLLSFLSPHEQEEVSRRIGNKIAELVDHRSTPAEETFYTNLTRGLSDTGMLDKEALELGVYMQRSPLFQTYPQYQSDFMQKVREITQYDDEEEQ